MHVLEYFSSVLKDFKRKVNIKTTKGFEEVEITVKAEAEAEADKFAKDFEKQAND